jgi:hypothetical protein
LLSSAPGVPSFAVSCGAGWGDEVASVVGTVEATGVSAAAVAVSDMGKVSWV